MNKQHTKLATLVEDIENMDELAYYDDDNWSNCCGALVYAETDICSDCKEHCELVSSSDIEENDTRLRFKYQ